ncbi:MAG: hypothetical protein ABSH17_10820, partial [Syntrophobacteraceae bacterium]
CSFLAIRIDILSIHVKGQKIKNELICYYTTTAVEDGATGVGRFCPLGSDGLAIARLDRFI